MTNLNILIFQLSVFWAPKSKIFAKFQDYFFNHGRFLIGKHCLLTPWPMGTWIWGAPIQLVWGKKRGIFFFRWSPYEKIFWKWGIFFLWCSPYDGEIRKSWIGEYFFFDLVLMRGIFFESIFCNSASRTLRSLRSLRAKAGLRPALACASLG